MVGVSDLSFQIAISATGLIATSSANYERSGEVDLLIKITVKL